MIKDTDLLGQSRYIRVKLSSPFVVRAVCKHCGGKPQFYYWTRNAYLYTNPRHATKQFAWILKFVKRMASDFYLIDEPKYYTKASRFAHWPMYKSYRPKIHRTIGLHPTGDIEECLTCQCGRSRWAFSQKSVVHRPEINQRKARSSFPKKFDC